jgi:glycosyltransferase involved in cell wall biosynthesis
VPCYNVADYLDNCVQSILDGCDGLEGRFEIILVDDGSTKDETPALVDAWQRRRPDVVRAIHQKNGGHGMAVNTGLEQARGVYFKVVDADDWLDGDAAREVMALLADFASRTRPLDLLITNYVYEKVYENKRTAIRYRSVMPAGRVFGWAELGRVKPYQNILMHSVIYRTELLRSMGFKLPSHTFYVDNIFVYVPLPLVESIYYCDVDMYRYFIGREGQSVNERVMASRIEQQLRITRVMIDAYDLDREVACERLRRYMENYLAMMMVICTVFLKISGRADAAQLHQGIWDYLQEHNPASARRIRHSALGHAVNLKGRAGRAVVIGGYRMARRIFKFN